MLKRFLLPAVAATVLLAGCSTGDLGKIQSDVEVLKKEVAELKAQLGIADDASDAGTQSHGEVPSDSAAQDFYGLGEPFVVEGVAYTVTEGERKPQLSENLVADEGYEFVLYHVDIHNTSQDDYHYSQSDYSIVTGAGEIEDNYLILSSGDQYAGHMGNGDLASNGKKSGWVAFEVPQGDQPLELRYEVRTFSSETSFKVKLQ